MYVVADKYFSCASSIIIYTGGLAENRSFEKILLF